MLPHYPDFNLPFVLYTDASGTGIGAVLTQLDGETERLIACAGKALTGPETRYSVTDQECLAVIWAVRKYRPYLEGYHFTVVTDHSSLRWLHNLKDPIGRLARWALDLSGYHMTIEYRRGTENETADAISRLYEDLEVDEEAVIDSLGDPVEKSWYERKYERIEQNLDGSRDFQIKGDQLYYLRQDPLKNGTEIDEEAWKLVVPPHQQHQVFEQCHDEPQAGHGGVEKTNSRVARMYYWPGMYRDTEYYVRDCITCAEHKIDQMRPAGIMGGRPIEQPWEVVASDAMGPYPESASGNCYLLVFEDLFTRWIECVPVPKVNAKTIGKAFKERVIHRWGTPKTFLTDNGTHYKNQALTQLIDSLGITRVYSPPYNAQANPVERVNRNL